ncbi:MAG: phosphoadenosine phosphosulfate reductase family protein [Cyanobacteria bacterium P01_A01_bin.135]
MQYSLFDPAFWEDSIPLFIQTVMSHGADLAVSVSGGKDSDAMLRFLSKRHSAKGWTGQLFALFCDLGRIEWAGVSEHLHSFCAELEVPLVRVIPKRSMIDEWQHRYNTIFEKQQHKPFWSSSSARYCTKHEKTQPSDKFLRQYSCVVCAIGLRAEESTARAKKPRYQVRDDIASTWYKTPKSCKTAEEKEAWAERAFQMWHRSGRRGRFALTWHPIHHWSLEEVWAYNGTSSIDIARRTALYQAGKIQQAIASFPCHWVYTTGNTRLSCSLCVLASSGDILNGAQHNPWIWSELALMEIIGGWGFQQNRWLASLHADVLKMSLAKRDRLWRVLYRLGLVRRWKPLFSFTLLHSCDVEQLLFWTNEAFLSIAGAIARYWADRVDKPSP